MANNTWKNYTQKSTALSDNDEVMLLDSTDEKNKRGLMSKFWNYVVDKMATAVISKLETNNKTIIGAINYLNDKSPFIESTQGWAETHTFNGTTFIVHVREVDGNTLFFVSNGKSYLLGGFRQNVSITATLNEHVTTITNHNGGCTMRAICII